MSMEEKNEYIKQYIKNISFQVNNKYGKELIDEEKISYAVDMLINSKDDLETEIIPKINKIVDDFIEFQQQIEKMMKKFEEDQLSEVATLNLNTEKDGIYLSQQQIDLLMIVEISSKDELKNYVENICVQFPNMKVEDLVPNFDNLQEEQLEEVKRTLYQRYQDELISYLDFEKMTYTEKARVKLERLGINGQELEKCISQVSQGKIKETFVYLGQKYGNDFITKFNRTMNDDFENVKAISYDKMKSLSELISRDETMDTIITTAKFDDVIQTSLNGNVFDPYLPQKALYYCLSHNKHMRYHALFDHAHVDTLLKQGKGLQDHDQILAEMKSFVKMSMEYIKRINSRMLDGTMLINTVEIFNELVEKNKSDKSSSYAMVWEKYFGITVDEIVSCFDGIEKPSGIEFMYNETTLTESRQKREMVEKVLFQIEQKNSNLIDSFGDQMHLSDEDVITKQGIQNLTETAQMLKRIQDGKIIVDGKQQSIKPKKTECTEHDFHFSKVFLEKLKKYSQNINLWAVKRGMQSLIEEIYKENGVNFGRSTYWTLFGQNDHNIVRTNIKIQGENRKRQQEGILPKPFIETMLAGLVPDGKKLSEVKTLKAKKQEKQQIDEKSNYLKWESINEKKKYELINAKNQVKQMANQYQNTFPMQNSNEKVLAKANKTSTGFANTLLLALITGFAGGMIATIMFLIINK